MNIPDDCVVVKTLPTVKGTHVGTWFIREGEVKTIPLHLYNLIPDKLELLENPHNLNIGSKPKEKPEPEEEPVDLDKEVKDVTDAILDGDIVKAGDETKDLIKKVKNIAKKNKK